MITRIWHGRTDARDENEYLDFLLNEGTDDYRRTPGNRSVKVWRKPEGAECHFWTVTEWDDIESVKAFAGEDYERAKYYPQDEGKLLDFEKEVTHYQSVDASSVRVKDFVRQLNSLFDGGSWQGESFAAKLRDLSPEVAFAQPVAGVHSIAEIVWHCTYWRMVAINHFEGDPGYRDRTVKENNFLPLAALQEKGWDAIYDGLLQSQWKLLSVLERCRDTVLQREYAPGYRLAYLVEGIIQHDLYHLGQIGLVKRMVTG